ncbi:hypothetical protein [Legionella jordanis]|uniref:Uncharacterized protein n=1 Tax=Legionella jordanis TaxID=456 RepID=A0A0W0VCA4_9GAMM|nr:hypothetical protein [Legionella jordanis]KTD17517.1 hypothetical protein Ljor_1823 [Legionella jordanis]RMX05145.1 hypothetical protein EAW55_00315 [Legionella jordanis]VEH13486.1 Uncharacterised protein [Legionella jordanis]HAT8714403.1 hypothetical protein [Legionella jordanis]
MPKKYKEKCELLRDVQETHYYQEKKQKIHEIKNFKLKKKIDSHMKSHKNMPPDGTTRESGYSVYCFSGSEVRANRAMVHAKKNGHAYILSRLKNAPKLPVSCLASAEHVISMQSEVEDFQSEFLPESKKQVVYEINLKINNPSNWKTERNKLLKVICENDDLLTAADIHLSCDKKSQIVTVELGTQQADIQHTIGNLRNARRYQILSCNFDAIQLNEGICLLKPDASNPIHALVNIAEGRSEGVTTKFFLERDAGKTSGQACSSYQDNKWTFNFFTSLSQMKQQTGFPENALAVKIVKK